MAEGISQQDEADGLALLWAVGKLSDLLDDEWHIRTYLMQGDRGRLYVIEASGGDGTDEEYVVEGTTLALAVRDLDERIRSRVQWEQDEDRREYDEGEWPVEG